MHYFEVLVAIDLLTIHIVKFSHETESAHTKMDVLGCARFSEFLQNFSGHKISWRMCLVVQTLLSVAPKLQFYVRPGEKCGQISKNEHTPVL